MVQSAGQGVETPPHQNHLEAATNPETDQGMVAGVVSKIFYHRKVKGTPKVQSKVVPMVGPKTTKEDTWAN